MRSTVLSCRNQPSEEINTYEAWTSAVLGGSMGAGTLGGGVGGTSPCDPTAGVSVSCTVNT